MNGRRLSPGAWLSGNFDVGAVVGPWGAGTSPPVSPASSNSPPVPQVLAFSPPVSSGHALSPPVPHGHGVSPPVPYVLAISPPVAPGLRSVGTRDGSQLTEPEQPWLGIDPDWAYTAGPAALRALALRKVRDRIAPKRDPRVPVQATGDVSSGRGHEQALWRWHPTYRVAAVVAELSAALSVQVHRERLNGQRQPAVHAQVAELWWLPSPARLMKARPALPRCLFKLVPPASNFQYDDQIDKVLRAAVEREVRLPEILVQADDIGSFFEAVTGIDRGMAPHLGELMEVAWTVGLQLVMAMKNGIAEWRPVQRSARVQPVIDTPGHGSLPSGHATLSALTAELLSTLLYDQRDPRRHTLDRLARRIAFNRVVAGVHFPMDSFAGHALGLALARTLVSLARDRDPRINPDCRVDSISELPELALFAAGRPMPTPAPPPEPAANGLPAAAAAAAVAPPPKSLWAKLWNAAAIQIANARP